MEKNGKRQKAKTKKSQCGRSIGLRDPSSNPSPISFPGHGLDIMNEEIIIGKSHFQLRLSTQDLSLLIHGLVFIT